MKRRRRVERAQNDGPVDSSIGRRDRGKSKIAKEKQILLDDKRWLSSLSSTRTALALSPHFTIRRVTGVTSFCSALFSLPYPSLPPPL